MTEKQFEIQYCIERYRWSRERGLTDKLYPIIAKLVIDFSLPPLSPKKKL